MNFLGLFGFAIFWPIFVIKGVPGDPARQGVFGGVLRVFRCVAGLLLVLQSPGQMRLV